jgi:N,N-dimethylformamidase beta subunit-like, C-terminal/Purple acid Phosphatase, N-terminal domain
MLTNWFKHALHCTSSFVLLLLLAGVSGQAVADQRAPIFAYQGVDEEACQNPANPVVAENCKPGTDEWLVQNYAGNIEIYTSQDSVNIGDTLDFLVDTTSPTFDLYIYRNGYYGGLGGRLVDSETGLQGVRQPDCVRAEDTGLRTCSNWSSSYSLTIPNDWVSGVYLVRVSRPDTGGENDTVFVVREDDRHSTILYQQSVTTFQAYNNFGGKSVYTTNSGICPTIADAARAVKVSLNRPYGQGADDPNYYFRVEYPMVRWLEQQGYDVTYSTSMDTHHSGKPGAVNHLLDHKIFLSVGHDEYWSQEMRDAVTAARDAGVNLGFFTANTSYWRVRFEPDPISNEPDSVMVVYKTTESGATDPISPTTTWRDPQGANNPENGLIGVMYIGDNDSFFFPLRVSAEEAKDPLFRHTGLQNMPPDHYADLGDQVVGWEWDRTVDNGHTPDGVTVIAGSPAYGMLLRDAGNSANGNLEAADVQTIHYTAPSGAQVFASGTIQWSWGLGAHGLDIVDADRPMAQITYNVLSDMGAQPATPADYVILDGSDTPDPVFPTDKIKAANSAVPAALSNIQTTIDTTSVTFSWDTDVETTGQVWFGERSDHINHNIKPDEGYSTHHSYTLEGLDPARTYYFKVVSVTRDWAITISDENSFQTGSLSFTGSIANTLKPIAQSGGCWVRANMIVSIILGVLALVVVIGVGWWLISRRRRTMTPSPSA